MFSLLDTCTIFYFNPMIGKFSSSYDDLLEDQALMVHHTSPRFIRSGDRTTYGNSWLGNQTHLYNSWSSSQQSYRSENRPIVEDSWLMNRTTKKLTMICPHRWSG